MARSLAEIEDAELGSLPAAPVLDHPSQRLAGIACLLITACGWALNWPAMKFLLQIWPPLFSRGLAGVIAAIGLALVARATRQSLAVPRAAIPRLCGAAFTNVFAWMGFSSLSMQWVSVGEGALLVYTMPIWATLFAWPVLGTRPSPRGFAALALGMIGVGVMLGGGGFSAGGSQVPGVLCALGAAILFALGTVLNGKPLPVAPIASTAWQVGIGCLPMMLLGLAFEHPRVAALTAPGFAAMAYMTVFPMGVCYLTWFGALRRLPPAAASTGMLLVPLIGTLSAAVILGEPFGPRQILSMVLTLGGVTLALRRR